MSLPDEISPVELNHLLEGGTELILLDVREQEEWDICHLPNATLKPLSQFAEWKNWALGLTLPVVVYCHSGVRSAHICKVLERLNGPNATNLLGGIHKWALDVDRRIPTY